VASLAAMQSGPLSALDAAGINLQAIDGGQRDVLATLSDDEVTTVTQLKQLLDEVARDEDIDRRSWWGGSIF